MFDIIHIKMKWSKYTMNYLLKSKQERLKSYLGTSLYNTLKKYKCIIAGGAITSIFAKSKINDVDVYFRCKEDLADFLSNEMDKYSCMIYTEKGVMFSVTHVNLHLIYFNYFNNTNELFDTFDFTICMGAFDFLTEEFVLHDRFLEHNADKSIVFNSNTKFPITSAFRLEKYIKKGYSISSSEYLKILLSIMNLKVDIYKDLKSQLGGMYGVDSGKFIDAKDDEKVDIIDTIKKLSDIDEDNLKRNINSDIYDVDAKLIALHVLHEDECINYFEYKENYYTFFKGEIIRIKNINIPFFNFKKVDISEVILSPIKKYKIVRKISDGLYSSYYDENFEYKIGEIAVAKCDDILDLNHYGIYCSDLKDISRSLFNQKKDAVCIEISVGFIDDILSPFLDKNIRVKEALVVREVDIKINSRFSEDLVYI